MRLSIDHRTVYRFAVPQGRLVQMLRLTPENTHDQTIASWRIDVDCDARLRTGRDGFGNVVTMLYAVGSINEELEFFQTNGLFQILNRLPVTRQEHHRLGFHGYQV